MVKLPPTLSARQFRALEILEANPGVRPREFARHFWPDSPGWMRACKCGPNGSHRGGGMYLAGGGYLGKLFNAGLAVVDSGGSRYGRGYALSPAGRKALEKRRAAAA